MWNPALHKPGATLACCVAGGPADKQDVRARLNLRWGVMPFRLDFGADPEENVDRTFALLKRRQLVQVGRPPPSSEACRPSSKP